jgi:hypothetical protein
VFISQQVYFSELKLLYVPKIGFLWKFINIDCVLRTVQLKGNYIITDFKPFFVGLDEKKCEKGAWHLQYL